MLVAVTLLETNLRMTVLFPCHYEDKYRQIVLRNSAFSIIWLYFNDLNDAFKETAHGEDNHVGIEYPPINQHWKLNNHLRGVVLAAITRQLLSSSMCIKCNTSCRAWYL